MRKKEIMAILSLILVSGGFVVRDIHDYNTQSDAIKYECIKIDSPTDKIEKLLEEHEEYKRQEYVQQKVEELRSEKERIRLEEEKQRQQEDQASQVVNRGGYIPSGREIDVEVSWYCACTQCCSGGSGVTASGSPCTENLTIAMPSEFPFGTKVLIDGTVYECQDTGSYIKTVNIDGVETVRVDIYTSSHQTALQKGRYRRKAIILN